MGSSYFGEPTMGNGRSSGSSKKGKKSSNSDKPKQPQRGLGVAQLEKIRLHHQMGSNNYLHTTPNYHHNNLNQEDVRMETAYSSVPSSSSSSSTSPSSFGFHHPNIMMGFRDMEGTDIRYGDPQSCTTTSRWNHNNGIIGTQFNTQPSLTRQLFSFQMEDSTQKKRRKDRCNSLGSSSQNSDSSEMQELDLDLKLSL